MSRLSRNFIIITKLTISPSRSPLQGVSYDKPLQRPSKRFHVRVMQSYLSRICGMQYLYRPKQQALKFGTYVRSITNFQSNAPSLGLICSYQRDLIIVLVGEFMLVPIKSKILKMASSNLQFLKIIPQNFTVLNSLLNSEMRFGERAPRLIELIKKLSFCQFVQRNWTEGSQQTSSSIDKGTLFVLSSSIQMSLFLKIVISACFQSGSVIQRLTFAQIILITCRIFFFDSYDCDRALSTFVINSALNSSTNCSLAEFYDLYSWIKTYPILDPFSRHARSVAICIFGFGISRYFHEYKCSIYLTGSDNPSSVILSHTIRSVYFFDYESSNFSNNFLVSASNGKASFVSRFRTNSNSISKFSFSVATAACSSNQTSRLLNSGVLLLSGAKCSTSNGQLSVSIVNFQCHISIRQQLVYFYPPEDLRGPCRCCPPGIHLLSC